MAKWVYELNDLFMKVFFIMKQFLFRFRLYVFLSLVVLLLNGSVECVQSLNCSVYLPMSILVEAYRVSEVLSCLLPTPATHVPWLKSRTHLPGVRHKC
jgi:hypothetical protein